MRDLQKELESNKLFEAIFHSISDGVIICDKEGNFVLWNAAAENIIGVGPHNSTPEMWAKHYGCYVSEDGPEFAYHDLPLFRAMLGEEVKDIEVYIKNKIKPGGVWVNANGRPLRDKNGNHFEGGVVLFHDITERKRQFQEQIEDLCSIQVDIKKRISDIDSEKHKDNRCK